MTLDYDKAAAARGKIEAKAGDRQWTFPGELPIDRAIEWLRVFNDTSIPAADRAQKNLELVIGADMIEEMTEKGIGWKTLNAIYTDLLDAYDLQSKPTGGDLGPLVDRLRNAVNRQADRKVLAKIIGELDDAVAGRTEGEEPSGES